MSPDRTPTSAEPALPPFGVVIPTMNCRSRLPVHLAGLRPWLHRAAEVVVVDSDSTDGTLEYLKENLAHPHLTFTSHPPGLYASWNHGIARIQSPFVFIATTGDLMTGEGLNRLLRTADTLACDVVISKPSYCDPQGRPLPDVILPIDDVISTLGLTTPRKLAKLEAVLFVAIHAAALLGNSASNIFRTATLRRFPFPTEFGHGGDGAWGLLHAPEIAWGVVPKRFSTFMVHPPAGSGAQPKSGAEVIRFDQVLRCSMENWRKSGLITEREMALLQWFELLAAMSSFLDAKKAFDLNRRGSIHWTLNPIAWRNRQKRQRATRRLQQLKREVLAALR